MVEFTMLEQTNIVVLVLERQKKKKKRHNPPTSVILSKNTWISAERISFIAGEKWDY